MALYRLARDTDVVQGTQRRAPVSSRHSPYCIRTVLWLINVSSAIETNIQNCYCNQQRIDVTYKCHYIPNDINRWSNHLLTWCCCWGSCLINCVVCWCWGCCGKCWYRWLCARPGLASPSLSPTVTQLIIFFRCVLWDVLCADTWPLVCDWLLECVCCIDWTTRGVDCVLKVKNIYDQLRVKQSREQNIPIQFKITLTLSMKKWH